MSEFYLQIEHGEIVEKRLIKAKFSELEDGSYKITINKGSKRTLPQNRYLHGVLIPEFRRALISVGYRVKDDSEAKQAFKAMFCTRHIESELTGEQIPIVRDTSTMDKKEMSDLFEEVIQFCAQHMNYLIPYPGEQQKFQYD